MQAVRWMALVFAIWGLCLGATSLEAAQVSIGGKSYISLDELARKLHLKYRIQADGKAASLYSRERALSFYENRHECIINKYKVLLGSPVLAYKKRLWITKQDCEHTLVPIIQPQRFHPKPKTYHIVLDPGHGGKDEGTQNPSLKLKEKQMTLDLALRLAKILKNHGFKVSLTRQSDSFVDLAKRSARANALAADLFVSLHFNAVPAATATSIKGIETYLLPGKNQPSSGRSKIEAIDKENYPGNHYNPWNAFLAYCIHSQLIDQLKSTDRGIKKARFAVLKDLECPGVLVECGFLSNPEEAKRIANPAYRDKLAMALAQGILKYKSQLGSS